MPLSLLAADPGSISWQIALLSCLTAFLLSHLIALVYDKTFEGLSWSKGLVQSMVLGSLVTCLLMMAIGDNIARGIGIVGSLAIIRFRTNLRDPRDLVFVFAALGVGVAAGVQAYAIALIGALSFCGAALFLRTMSFGARRAHDGLLRFQLPADADRAAQVTEALRRTTRRFALVTLRDVAQGTRIDYAYQLTLKQPDHPDILLDELKRIDGLSGLAFVSQQATVEV